MSLKDLLPTGTYEEIKKEASKLESANQASLQRSLSKLEGNDTLPLDKEQALEEQKVKEALASGQLVVSCPYCHKKIVYSASNPFRPFCSERCKLLDLGAWASDERKIAGSNQEDLD